MSKFWKWLVFVFTDVGPNPPRRPPFDHVAQVRGSLSQLHNALTGNAFEAHSYNQMEEIKQGMLSLVKEIDYRRSNWRDGRIKRALEELDRYGIGEKEIAAVWRGEKEKPPIDRPAE